MKSKRFQTACVLLPHGSFTNRKSLFCKPETGLLQLNEAPVEVDPMAALQNSPMGNPDSMMGMLKNNLFMAFLFPIQYGIVSYFFSGMLIGKVAFPLTQQFREMLQKGIDVHNIDVKYISSLSLYFLSFMGIDKFFSLISKDENLQQNMSQMNAGMAQPNPFAAQGGAQKSFKAEIDNIKTLRHQFLFEKDDELFVSQNAYLLA